MPGGASGFEIRLGVSIPMSDGVSLNADLLLPKGAEPQPCLLTMTPYTTDFAYASAAAFARQGFAVCIVDVRGRGGSGGSFDLNHDGPDGAACVNWIAVQPWCDGKVAMFGGSYSGMNQWSVAAERPAALRAIAPLVAPLVGLDGGDAYREIVYPYTARWAALVQGKTLHMGLLKDEDYWRGLFFRHWEQGHGVEKLAWLTGALDPIMETNLKGLQDAAWVARCSPTPTQYAAIDIPVLSGTGTAENAQRGALEYRRRHLEARPDAQHWLMIGPTTHAGTRDPAPSDRAAQTTARDEVATKEDETVLGFYNWALRGTPLPEFLDSPAKIYLAEAEVWCALPEVHRHTALFLSNGSLQTIPPKSFGVTRLQGPPPPQPPAEVASLFVVLSGENGLESWHLTDHSGAQRTFLSEPLDQPMDIVGPAHAELDLVCSHAGLDVAVVVYAIFPGGQTRILTTDMARIDGLVARPLLLNGFRLAAVRLPSGTRFAFQIRILNTPDFQRSDTAIAAKGSEEIMLSEGQSVLYLPLYPVGALA
jgi:putative CocE/NonD family hydrolase